MIHLKLFFRGLKEGFIEFGHAVSGIVNTVVLSVVYLLGVGVTSLAAKIAGKTFMDVRLEPGSASYWREFEKKDARIEDAYRQF